MLYENLPNDLYIVGDRVSDQLMNIIIEQDSSKNYWFAVWSNEEPCETFKKLCKYRRNVSKIDRVYLSQMLKEFNFVCSCKSPDFKKISDYHQSSANRNSCSGIGDVCAA